MGALLEIRDLTTTVKGEMGSYDVLSGVSFSIEQGETVGIVGESGCGKSMTALSVMGLLGKNAAVRTGQALFDGKDLVRLDERELDSVRGRMIGMIYQDALSALNPVFTVGNQLTETMRAHLDVSRAEARARATELLGRMGLADPAATMKKYPHMLSGGQRQRVMIAMALCCSPKLLIADEPTTALDVTVQAQIMRLLREEREASGMSLWLISHDIGLIAQTCDRVLVMYAGQIIEQATAEELFAHPAHPYTEMLLRSVPRVDGAREALCSIAGQVPARYGEMVGCRFAPRCPYACQACQRSQEMYTVGESHAVRCHCAAGKEAAV
ncbi:MAG: ABC transporter ATP-binding protein [Clostridia bacterium]|nr:ABC transporter ATP-binding protein [Clostridia bacterium]